MIITSIIGGLGNQMFQYSLGRALSLKRNEQLRVDISGFLNYGLHQGYELGSVFVCEPAIATQREIRELIGYRVHPIFRRAVRRLKLWRVAGSRLVVEPQFHHWPGINSVLGNVFLDGYWQSEKYFSEVTDVIRSDFQFKFPLTEKNSDIAERIARTQAISLHVRRGDYVSDPKTRATLELCSPDYYRAAIGYVAERVSTPEFFVFSDDIPWVRANLDIGFPCHYIDHNLGAESYRDMQLMSLCRHHIIANSSFSWWGAWLNPDPGKIVVAPRNWFANGNRVDDLIPVSWVKL